MNGPTFKRDSFPRPLGDDFMRAEDRVPREISGAPPLWVELTIVLFLFGAFLLAIPYIASFVTTLQAS